MSIFSPQLKFEPLTPARARLMKLEIVARTSAITLVGLVLLAQFYRVEIDSFFNHLFQPLRDFLTALFHPLSMELARLLAPVFQVLSNFSRDSQIGAKLRGLRPYLTLVGFGLHALFVLLMPLVPLFIFICFQSGVFGKGGTGRQYKSVISTEFRKWWLRYFEPSI